MDQQVYQQLLGSLGGAGTAQPPTTEALIEQLGESNPQLKLLAQYMAQRQSAAAEDADERDDELPDRRAGEQAAAQRLRRIARRMYAELEELRQRNDALAEALGACYLCWGEDSACEACNGNGQPGSAPPDKALFAQYVAPALQAMRVRRSDTMTR